MLLPFDVAFVAPFYAYVSSKISAVAHFFQFPSVLLNSYSFYDKIVYFFFIAVKDKKLNQSF